MQHTELPWKVYYKTFRPQLSKMKIIEIQDAEGHPIVAWSGFDGVRTKTECLRNARFIVRACNDYYNLLEALRSGYCEIDELTKQNAKLLEALKAMIPYYEACAYSNQEEMILMDARQAIAEAEGRE